MVYYTILYYTILYFTLHTYEHTYIHTYRQTCMCIYIYALAQLHACMHAFIHEYLHTQLCRCLYYMYVFTHMYMYIYIHMYTWILRRHIPVHFSCTHMHIRVWMVMPACINMCLGTSLFSHAFREGSPGHTATLKQPSSCEALWSVKTLNPKPLMLYPA